ncbi:MAG: type I 3-dehydroquinate dehydratase [Eubacterium sp.]|nr:type I 3-dehydroquinate dehydratase [Eubacterium sp.]
MKKCIPIMAKKLDEAVEIAANAAKLKCDFVEWRIDCLESGIDKETFLTGWKTIKEICPVPVIVTLRTAREGGQKDLDITEYNRALYGIIKYMKPEILDIELNACGGDASVNMIIRNAHREGVKVILSYHDMLYTGEARDVEMMLCRMKYIGADIPKVAYMANSVQDVENLKMGAKAASEYIGEIIAISMGELGVETRIKGKDFGSIITFVQPVGSGYDPNKSIGQLPL